MTFVAANEWDGARHGPLLRTAVEQTLQMVSVTLVIGGLLGLLLGLALYATRRGGLYSNGFVYNSLSLIVNVIRPIPFIIFITAIRPLTLEVVGKSLGTEAAIFPMIIVCTVATARIIEQNLVSTDPGIVEAARAMGASRLHVLVRVLIPEALSPIILGYAFLFVGVLDMSAMAGVIGGGGLGQFALNYGYNRYNDLVTLVAVVIMIALVQVVQQLGNVLSRRVMHR